VICLAPDVTSRLTVIEVSREYDIGVAPVGSPQAISTQCVGTCISFRCGLRLSLLQDLLRLLMPFDDSMSVHGQTVMVGVGRTIGEIASIEMVSSQRQGQNSSSEEQETSCHIEMYVQRSNGVRKRYTGTRC